MLRRRIALIAGFLLLVGSGAVRGQYVSGSFSLTGTAGYQTNPYLDPVLGEWDPAADPAFFALDPAVGLRWSTSSVQVGLQGRMRAYPRRMDQSSVQLVRVAGSGRYRWSDTWSVGLQGGASRYRLASERDTWWALPALQWTPGSRMRFDVQIGMAGRRSHLAETTSRQTSVLGVLSGRTWITDRVQGRLSVYLSNSRTATIETTYGGAGLTAAATYWPTDRLALTLQSTFEQIRYEMTTQESSDEPGPPDDLPIGGEPASETPLTQTDHLWRAGAEVDWTMGRGVTLFARARAMRADLTRSGTTFDGHVGGGLRLRLSRTLARPDASEGFGGLWASTQEGVRFRIRYRGAGQLYVTGDFNNWADPGVPLRETEDDVYTTTLDVEPGRYEYNIRIVSENEEKWLDLPDDARTVDDGFGGQNGVCIVE